MSPPGKNGGCTTKVSVVNAMRSSAELQDGAVAELRKRLVAERGQQQALDQVRGLAPAAAVRHLDDLVVLDRQRAGHPGRLQVEVQATPSWTAARP